MQSTYSLAVEAYTLIKGLYDQAALTQPSDTLGSETYGSMAIPVRLVLRKLGYTPASTTEIENSEAENFIYGVIFYTLSAIHSSVAASSGSTIQIGPIKIENKNYIAEVNNAFAFWAKMAADFLGLDAVNNRLKLVEREWSWELTQTLDQYAELPS